MKTLTITIKNIPEDFLKAGWELAKKQSKQSTGISIEETDNVEIDASIGWKENSYYIGDCISSAFVLHTLDTANKSFGNKSD